MLKLIEKALAQPSPAPIVPVPPASVGSIQNFIMRGLTWLFYAVGVAAVVYLIYGGIIYITAGGDSEKATKGKTAVINAVIGIIIVLLALAIITWVTSVVLSNAS